MIVMAGLFRRPRRRGAAIHELMRCAPCGSDFVTPVEWAQRDGASWWMRLRCGECGDAREVVVTQDAADRFDRALDRGLDAIAATLERLDRERMNAEAEAFATALRLDLLDAADFGAPR